MFKKIVEELFAQVSSIDLDPHLIEIPQDRSMGDFALPCFSFAKQLKKSPQDIAKDLVAEMTPTDAIHKIEAVGPYVNVSFHTSYVAQEVIQEVMKDKDLYGSGKDKDEKMVIESPGPNTNKPLHLWHVRNMLLGNTLAAVADFAWYDVSKVDIVNDRGVHICKSMLAYETWGNGAEPDKKSDHYVGDRYVRYDAESKKDPELENKIQDMLVKREQWDEHVRALREKMRKRALEWMHETYERYGCHIDKAYFESDHYEKGKDLVLKWLQDGIFKKNDKGNIIFQDEDDNEKVVLRSDGTAIYMTQDIALGQIRFQDWKMDRMVYVVGNEQADHFSSLFKIFEKLGYEFGKKCHHLSYGMISLPDGKMKSREGNVVDADNLVDEMQASSLEMLNDRYPDEDNTALAEQIAFAAIKFFVLKYDAKKDFVFDRNESLSFDGESGPYIQYTHARCESIKLKAKSEKLKDEWVSVDYSLLDKDSERLLLLHLSEFGDAVSKSADEYKPSLIARYTLELARMFNAYYQQTKIILEDDESTTQARLALVASVQQVLKTGLWLLWIQAPDKM